MKGFVVVVAIIQSSDKHLFGSSSLRRVQPHYCVWAERTECEKVINKQQLLKPFPSLPVGCSGQRQPRHIHPV